MLLRKAFLVMLTASLSNLVYFMPCKLLIDMHLSKCVRLVCSIPLGEFVEVEQTVDIPYDSNWNSTNSASYLHFYTEFSMTASDLFDLPGFVGVNILDVER